MNKAGFWCPPEVHAAIKDLVEKQIYQDQSKALVGLLRRGLLADTQLPADLRERFYALARYLQRDPDIILRQCVEGILGMMDAEARIPLIVEEVGLLQKRTQLGADPHRFPPVE